MDIKKKIGILFQPKSQDAMDLAHRLEDVIGDLGASSWICSAWEEDTAKGLVEGTELLICLGGDGTILRAARIINPFSIPIISVNLGRVGFMTELPAEDALYRIPAFIQGEGWIEERNMIEAEILSKDGSVFHALNDVVVGRGERCRLIRINAKVDGENVETYKCDGIILATATGSTGYSLAAGGPVIHPLSQDIIMKPIAAHLSSSTAVILPLDTIVELEVNTFHSATLSIDGQIEVALSNGDCVRVKQSANKTRLLRSERPKYYYGYLMRKLGERE